jgi:hypothetical protein
VLLSSTGRLGLPKSSRGDESKGDGLNCSEPRLVFDSTQQELLQTVVCKDGDRCSQTVDIFHSLELGAWSNDVERFGGRSNLVA